MEGSKEPDSKEPGSKEPGAEDQGQVSELDQVSGPDQGQVSGQVSDTTVETKPSNQRQVIELAPSLSTLVAPSPSTLVEIDDELFKKVLFFSLFRAAVFSNFSDSNYNINNIKFEEIQDIGFLNDHKKEYLEITGFVETIIVLGYELRNIGFIKYGFATVEDVADLQNTYSGSVSGYNTNFIGIHEPDSFYFDSIRGNKFTFNKQKPEWMKHTRPRLNTRINTVIANIDNNVECDSKICYDIIKLVASQLEHASNKTYITVRQHNTLSNYVELLEKLITRQIVIEIRDGELFADNIKIGFKQSIQNRVTNFCRRTFASAATIHTADANTKLYDTILSVYRHSIINTRYKLEIDNKTFCGGRNNKTRKRHRNKTTYKKMQKTHNIRKRKSNGTKRK